MKRVLVISFSDLRSDPRVRRQIDMLRGDFRLTAVGFADPGIAGVEFFPVPSHRFGFCDNIRSAIFLKLRQFEKFYWSKHSMSDLSDRLQNICFDLVVANDIDSLPLALKIAGTAKVILDCHEYAPREFEDIFRWRFFFQEYKEYLCRTYMKYCDVITTVCEGIADEYSRNFGVQSVVITNAADFVTIEPSEVADGSVRLIHHGGALPSRRIEMMIRMMDYLDERFTLTLMLVRNNPSYYRSLVKMAADNPRIIFREPVPLDQIVTEINQFDLGIYILQPNNFNNQHALPNKFFEFIQARLAVAIGPSPEMARLVTTYDLGIVAQDFEPHTLARLLNGLSLTTIEYYKQRADESSYELSSDGNRARFLDIVGQLLDE